MIVPLIVTQSNEEFASSFRKKMIEWYLLPGMGASSAMYNALKRRLSFNVNFVNWPQYQGEKTYSEVAARIITENRIADGDVIGGSSLGGIVSLEIAKQIKPLATILLGSAMNPSEVQGLLRLLSPIAEVTPISLLQLVAGKNGNLVSSMFSKSDSKFIRAMCLYLPSWPGYSGPTDNIYRLHGRKDHVIPCPSVGADVIENAGHLLVMTHVQETAKFLENVRSKLHRT
jgi:hypothetical protein